MELWIYYITNNYIGTELFCKHLYNLLIKNEIIFPEKIGNFEPLKEKFLENYNKFRKYWFNTNTLAINSILWKSKKGKNYGMCQYGKGALPFFNTLSITINLKKQTEISNLLQPFIQFFDENNFLFGRICLNDEYDKYNILQNTNFFFNKKGEKIIFNDGSTCPILAVGTNIQKHLPGLYWKTILGKIYVNWIGKHKILKSNPFKIQELPNGAIEIQAYNSPEKYNTTIAESHISKIKDYIGNNIFFDKQNIDKETIAPNIDLSEIIL